MVVMSDSGKAASRPRIRAKKACKSCNVRRVRCDVTEGRPCTNCKNANASCELMDSRRGSMSNLIIHLATLTKDPQNMIGMLGEHLPKPQSRMGLP